MSEFLLVQFHNSRDFDIVEKDSVVSTNNEKIEKGCKVKIRWYGDNKKYVVIVRGFSDDRIELQEEMTEILEEMNEEVPLVTLLPVGAANNYCPSTSKKKTTKKEQLIEEKEKRAQEIVIHSGSPPEEEDTRLSACAQAIADSIQGPPATNFASLISPQPPLFDPSQSYIPAEGPTGNCGCHCEEQIKQVSTNQEKILSLLNVLIHRAPPGPTLTFGEDTPAPSGALIENLPNALPRTSIANLPDLPIDAYLSIDTIDSFV